MKIGIGLYVKVQFKTSWNDVSTKTSAQEINVAGESGFTEGGHSQGINNGKTVGWVVGDFMGKIPTKTRSESFQIRHGGNGRKRDAKNKNCDKLKLEKKTREKNYKKKPLRAKQVS